MMNYIINNLSTIIISIGLFLLIIYLIRKIIKDKKNGCSSCGGGCGGCSTTGCTDFSEEAMRAAIEKIKNK